MGPGIISLIVFGVIVVFFIMFVVGIYNSLVKKSEVYKNAFAQIEVQLKRRYDLIPNLVEIARGYMSHEKETLEAVIAARNQAAGALGKVAANPGDASAIAGLAGGEGALMGAMSRLNVVMEAYPDLKANQNMMQLTEELTSTENKISFARQAFNDAVTAFNMYRKQFPTVIFAGMFGYQDASLLEFADSDRIQEAPKVSF
jgi:LemA protein